MGWLSRIEIIGIEIVGKEREVPPQESGDWQYRHFEATKEVTIQINGRIKEAADLTDARSSR